MRCYLLLLKAGKSVTLQPRSKASAHEPSTVEWMGGLLAVCTSRGSSSRKHSSTHGVMLAQLCLQLHMMAFDCLVGLAHC